MASGLATDVQGLKGDEDDDERESTTQGSIPGGDGDNDTDNDTKDNSRYGYQDPDDVAVTRYGVGASTREAHALAALVRRYHAASAAGDGAKACTMMAAPLVKALPEDYAQPRSPTYLRGAKTCAGVLSALFAHSHEQLVVPIHVTAVRLKGSEGKVTIGSTAVPASYIPIIREGRVWKIDMLLEEPLP